MLSEQQVQMARVAGFWLNWLKFRAIALSDQAMLSSMQLQRAVQTEIQVSSDDQQLPGI